MEEGNNKGKGLFEVNALNLTPVGSWKLEVGSTSYERKEKRIYDLRITMSDVLFTIYKFESLEEGNSGQRSKINQDVRVKNGLKFLPKTH